MPAHVLVSALFREEPVQWGLRGDPYLWREMEERLANVRCPESEGELGRILETAFQDLTGRPISYAEPTHVARYSHGGMSSGFVSPGFWRDSAIPLLMRRYRAITASDRVHD